LGSEWFRISASWPGFAAQPRRALGHRRSQARSMDDPSAGLGSPPRCMAPTRSGSEFLESVPTSLPRGSSPMSSESDSPESQTAQLGKDEIQTLRRRVSLHPEDSQLHYQLGLILARTGAHDEAIAEFEQARAGTSPML